MQASNFRLNCQPICNNIRNAYNYSKMNAQNLFLPNVSQKADGKTAFSDLS